MTTATSPVTQLRAVTAYALRVCAPRWFVALIPVAALLLFGALATLPDESAAVALRRVLGPGLYGLVLPITCLVVGDALLAAEVRAGTFSFTYLSPVRLATIVVGRWLAGVALCSALLVPASVLAALVAGAPGSAGVVALSVVAGSAAYTAVLLAVGASFARAVVWGLALVLLVERLLGAALSGIAQWCPGWLAAGVHDGLVDALGGRKGVPQGGSALLRLAIVTVVGLLIATRRLRQLRAGAQD